MTTQKKHTISVLVENKFGVLARVAGMFSGRGFNIHSLNVAPTHVADRSRITVTVRGDNAQLDQAIKQLHKLINVIDVEDLQRGMFVARELIMLKVTATAETRGQIIEICDVFRAKVVDVSPGDMIIEVTGNDNKCRAFLAMIEPFGILEMARTGNVALERAVVGDE